MSIRKFETRQCDRCGFSEELIEGTAVVAGWRAIVSLALDGRAAPVGSMPLRFDLCPSCCASIHEWWQDAGR